MKTNIKQLDQAMLCPSYVELSKQYSPMNLESTGYNSRAAEIIDIYYSRFIGATNFKKTRIRQMFSELVDEHYLKHGGDINKIDAEKLLFDEFINCCFKRVDNNSEVMTKVPIEMSVDYNHIIYGTIDAIVDKIKRPRTLSIILYEHKPLYPIGRESTSSMTLKFIKSCLMDIYNFESLSRSNFVIYSFSPPSVRIIKMSSVSLRNFRNIAGRIATSIEIGLLYPHPGHHCYTCDMRNRCMYRIHRSASESDGQQDGNELLKFLEA